MTGKPLVSHIYTADPSAHVFNGRLYVYPSHDRDTAIPFNDNGDQYDMADYHVLSLDAIDGSETSVTDHGVALAIEDIPWVQKQLWAPDAAARNGRYFLYFPARDKAGVFRIGVAVADRPEGPFAARPEPIRGSFSIDPAVFVDDDDDDGEKGKAGGGGGGGGEGHAYMYFGGLWGGQLQCWSGDGESGGGGGTVFDASRAGPQEPSGAGVPALRPRVARLAQDMLEFDTAVRELEILDADGRPLAADDHDRRFFEAAWMHKRAGRYYFSYSTGDTHRVVYATGDSPWGPFTYRGRILGPVLGWTTHHSIVEFRGRWYLFYHDCELSRGVDHLRSVKVREIFYDKEGNIKPAL